MSDVREGKDAWKKKRLWPDWRHGHVKYLRPLVSEIESNKMKNYNFLKNFIGKPKGETCLAVLGLEWMKILSKIKQNVRN